MNAMFLVLCFATAGVDGASPAGNSLSSTVTINSLYCGPDCVYVLAKLKGHNVTYKEILSDVTLTDKGVSMGDLKRCVEKHIGLEVEGYHLSYSQVRRSFDDFAIARLNAPSHQGREVIAHWVLLKSVDRSGVTCISPPFGELRFSLSEFMDYWTGDVLMQPIHSVSFLSALFIVGSLLFFASVPFYIAQKGRKYAL